MTTLNRCTSCRAALRVEETGRQGCLACQQTAAQGLRDLSGRTGLYAALSGALAPSGPAVGPRTSGGASEPSLGCDARVLDLMSPTTGVHAVLLSWTVDWYRLMGLRLQDPRFETLCRTLAFHVDWAARQHPAWADFATELRRQVALCREVTGQADRRPTVGTCRRILPDRTECGGDLRYDPETVTTRCRACRTTAPVDWRAVRAAVTRTAA
ncbi:hypothetical protein [Streptomyces nitrosporeus]|uniref:hypothetical protein n=1 Tax=Streptomyces nitrosporeus TaxID=28894 RepID=UPI00167C7B7B|nr:hypothetical protein [Streptomyces nitrosporeus]GGZ27843.1 hypothetical protein GCM10010327_67820 [Streptomyces nitrosporeus]